MCTTGLALRRVHGFKKLHGVSFFKYPPTGSGDRDKVTCDTARQRQTLQRLQRLRHESASNQRLPATNCLQYRRLACFTRWNSRFPKSSGLYRLTGTVIAPSPRPACLDAPLHADETSKTIGFTPQHVVAAAWEQVRLLAAGDHGYMVPEGQP